MYESSIAGRTDWNVDGVQRNFNAAKLTYSTAAIHKRNKSLIAGLTGEGAETSGLVIE